MSEIYIGSTRLIELVKNSPVLWNRSLQSYKNKDKTHEAWTNVCRAIWPQYDKLDNVEMKHLAQQAKKKWSNIRDHYLKSCKRIECKGKYDGVKPRRYVYYNLLRFLDGQGYASKETSAPDCSSIELSRSEDLSHEELSDDNLVIEYVNSPENSITSEVPQRTTKRHNINESSTEPPEDRHFLFFKGITPSLRRFTEEQTIDFQLGVLKLIKNIKSSSYLPIPNQQSHFSLSPDSNPFLHRQQQMSVQKYQNVKTSATKSNQPTASVTSLNTKVTSSSGPKPHILSQPMSPALSDLSDESHLSESNF